MGRRVADAVERFRYKHKHEPSIKEFADLLRNEPVQRIFRGEADVLKCLPSLRVLTTLPSRSGQQPPKGAFGQRLRILTDADVGKIAPDRQGGDAVQQ